MPVAVLTILKLTLLALLYLFLFRAVRILLAELYGPTARRTDTPPRPAVATSEPPRRSRKIPREVVVHAPSGRPRVIRLDAEPLRLGRAGNANVLVDDVYVSDEHAEIVPDDSGWSVRDLGSTNGTFLNGAKVTRSTPLASGDQLQVGKTRIELRR